MDTDRFSVLLVDDDLVQIDLARHVVSEICPEIELATVAGGDAVLHWFSANILNNKPLPHIILMDLKLPKLDGLGVLRKLRSHTDTSEIPIVVFSAVYTQADVLTSYKAGANSFLAKPIDFAGYTELFRERLAYWKQPQQRGPIILAKGGAAGQV